MLIGQAPGTVVHKSVIPWDDKSGDNLRDWLGVTKQEFYDAKSFAIIPMGFCYPGKGKSGDFPINNRAEAVSTFRIYCA